MFPFDDTLTWWVGLCWYAALVAVSFAVTWIATDIARVRRTPYIGVLTVLTGAFLAGYLIWVGAGRAFWTRAWAWGVLGGVIAGMVVVAFARRLPRIATRRLVEIARMFGWEGAVYGAAEGLLLSVLPVALVWQSLRSLGWTDGFLETAGASALAIIASVVVIVVHHLGYWEFRNSMMRYPVISCGILSIAYLATGNVIAPIVGHIVLHTAMIQRGLELPPHAHPMAGVEGLQAAEGAKESESVHR